MIDDIIKSIEWLEGRLKSEDIVSIGIVIDKLAIQSMTLAEQVSEAYALMNEAEDEYNHAVAKFIKEFPGARNRADIEAEVEFEDKKKHWTETKNVYKRLNMYLDRVDKIIESHRQRVSVIKQSSMKNV
jgi:tRNA U34 5-carboxymethylaminomethyl modifying GTPase MnmE/TrmE